MMIMEEYLKYAIYSAIGAVNIIQRKSGCIKEDDMKYLYFISYSHSSGFGNCTFAMDKEIKTYDDIKSVQAKINESNGVSGIVVLHFVLLGMVEDE